MNKAVKIILIIIVVLFVTYMVLAWANIFKMYNNPTTANEPGIPLNSKMFVSNLVTPEIGDFICYQYDDPTFGKHIRVHRLLGKAGDVLEIKNGVVFRNNKNIDKDLQLKHLYVLNPPQYKELTDKKVINEEDVIYNPQEGVYAFVLDKTAKQLGIASQIKTQASDQIDEYISKIYNRKWNVDNFGPLTIPPGKCFVLGDNRHNSQDSRYIGLIDESDIVGTVIR